MRPAVLFGSQGILITNIAWALRRFPVFFMFGNGAYHMQPIQVDDLAAIMVEQGKSRESSLVHALGPEDFTYRELVEMIGAAIGKNRPIIGVPPWLGFCLAWAIGKLKGDIFVTRDEIDGLMADTLHAPGQPPTPAASVFPTGQEGMPTLSAVSTITNWPGGLREKAPEGFDSPAGGCSRKAARRRITHIYSTSDSFPDPTHFSGGIMSGSFWRLVVRSEFSAAHALRHYQGKCEAAHGHNFSVEAVVQGNSLTPDTELLVDFSLIKKDLNGVLEKLDHRDLNNTPPFDRINPSSENLSRHIYKELAPLTAKHGVRLHSVTVGERAIQSATYFEGCDES